MEESRNKKTPKIVLSEKGSLYLVKEFPGGKSSPIIFVAIKRGKAEEHIESIQWRQ